MAHSDCNHFTLDSETSNSDPDSGYELGVSRTAYIHYSNDTVNHKYTCSKMANRDCNQSLSVSFLNGTPSCRSTTVL